MPKVELEGGKSPGQLLPEQLILLYLLARPNLKVMLHTESLIHFRIVSRVLLVPASETVRIFLK